MKKFIILSLATWLLGALAFAQSNNPNNPNYIPPVVEVDTDFYLAEGVPLETILEAAWSKRTRGYTQGALTYYQYAVERYPSSYEAHMARAGYYREIGQLTNALAVYNSALGIAVSPEDQSSAKYFLERVEIELLWGLQATEEYETAYSQYSQGNYHRAILGFLSLTNKNPEWIEAQYWLGRSYLESGQHQLARDRLNKVAQSNDVNSEIYKGAKWLLTTF